MAPDKVCVHACLCEVLCYLSGSRSTMPITIIFFPGRMPPRMRPLNGTVYALHTLNLLRTARSEHQTRTLGKSFKYFIPGGVINPPCQVR